MRGPFTLVQDLMFIHPIDVVTAVISSVYSVVCCIIVIAGLLSTYVAVTSGRDPVVSR